MTPPELLLFPISHYCEKARWALDHHGIAHRVTNLAPGPHAPILRRLGAEGTSVPVLRTDDALVQGSAEIIDWCDAHGAEPARTLTPAPLAEEARAIEARLDGELGVQVRRHAYSTLLGEAPAGVRRRFTSTVGPGQGLMVRLMWPMLRRVMTRAMDLGPEQRIDARDRISAELDWLDELLVDGRPYLLGEGFTRADLTAASLLSPVAQPPERPAQSGEPVPASMLEDVEEWRARPAIEWARHIYRTHRAAS